MNFDKLFTLAKKEKITEIEVFTQHNEGMNISLFHGAVDKYVVNDTNGLAVRGIFKGKIGYVSAENSSDDNIPFIIRKLKENASALTSSEESIIYGGSDSYPDEAGTAYDFLNISPQVKIDFLKALEKKVLSLDKRVTEVSRCSLSQRKITTTIINSKGLNLKKEKAYIFVYVSCVAKENDDVKNGGDYQVVNQFKDLKPDEMARNAVDKAVRLLGASSVPSKKYPVIFQNEMVSDLLTAFMPMFSGESVIKGTTSLKDKLNSKIVSDKITLVDDPFFAQSYIKEPFDDEGVACSVKNIIENGVLKTFLHNLKTANALKVKPTGNGFMSEVTSTIGISSTNLYLKAGDTSFADMVSSVDEGLLITSLQGLNAGVNTVTGDFNLQSSGFMIEKGKITRPVTLIVVGGNFIDMLNNVEYIGNDFKFTISETGCPSLKVKELVISGK